ncbi:MAG: hypothetical protein HPY69_07650 [Armatimonadetes bacterium]|nr:hypothetical protein [Armatimonadota bacterium]
MLVAFLLPIIALSLESGTEADPLQAPIDIGDRRELFVDRLLIERLDNAALRLHEPVSGGVVIRLDKPWEGPGNFPMSVFEHGGRLLMYYRAMRVDTGDPLGVLCVAISEDGGETWAKPALGLVEWGGTRETNICANEQGRPLMVIPWLNTRPGVPEDQRIKAIHSEPLSGEAHTAYQDPAGPKRLVFWVSADGFTFRKLDPQPEMVSDLRNCFDGGNTLFWSEAEQQYVLYYRWYESEGGRGWRSMARATSKDLFHWSESIPMTYGDTPREEFYTNNTTPYFRAPHIYIAPAARFMEGRRVITDEQAAAIGLKASHGNFYGNDCSDAVLLTSRAGSTRYDRTFMETFIRPGPGAGNWVSRTNYPVTGILPAGPDRIQMFVARHYMQDSWHIERLLLRTDGFVSITAAWAGGEAVTRSLVFRGSRLEINYRTGAAGSVRVEIQDETDAPIPGRSLADCREIIGDEMDRVVTWQDGSDLSALAGRAVCLRFVLRDADLFSLRFRG